MLYYTGYNNAAIKDNLKGTVEIAEGLTASSASVAIVSGNMSFQDVTGRGEYKFTPQKMTLMDRLRLISVPYHRRSR
ncbi:MAG: hypothetical protein ACLUIQ_03340 [Dialister invisus]